MNYLKRLLFNLPSPQTTILQQMTLKTPADENLVVIDLSIPQVYKEADVSGAIHFNCPHIVHRHDDVDCDEPSDNDLSEALPELDLLPGHIIVA